LHRCLIVEATIFIPIDRAGDIDHFYIDYVDVPNTFNKNIWKKSFYLNKSIEIFLVENIISSRRLSLYLASFRKSIGKDYFVISQL